jgi:hypothetical protein
MKALVLILIVSAALCFAACDDDGGSGFKPQDKFLEPTSPENVLHNFEAAYDEMDYEHFWPLIHNDFTFIFVDNDIDIFPDDIPASGVWGKPEELLAHEHMLNPNYVPEEYPELKIANLALDLEFSGDLKACNLEGAPAGTLEGFVTLDLFVTTVGEIDYLVRSRPRFYFAHAGSSIAGADTTIYWRIWRIEDAPFGQPSLNTGMTDQFSAKEPVSNTMESGDMSRRMPGTESSSWGSIKALYR